MKPEEPAWSAPPRGAVAIEDGAWSPRLETNRTRAIHYQWERYEENGTVDNFRILAGRAKGMRRGFFYADSDLHKWADAAARILGSGHDELLEARLLEYESLMASCQAEDGYLFTYNQLLFPGTRWKNLMLEHELYCLGHFIEAGASRFEASGRVELLGLAEKAAALVVREFREAGPERTSGHEEIEIALLRLYRITRKAEYLETARNLLERRGRIKAFGAKFAAQVLSQLRRSGAAARASPESRLGFELGANMRDKEPLFLKLRALSLFLSGAYQQQDRPIREQVEPRGHAVRWAYLMTAAAMLHRESPDPSLLAWMEAAWERLVDEKMYVTGGIGSLPLVEGFGRPFELDNRHAYAETCAAIGSILWNRELSLATGTARYADLIEWQLENAASVGISLTGDRYFYRNPLSADGELERRAWYATACCPSNISRLFAELPGLLYSRAEGELRVELYVGSRARLGEGLELRLESELPWAGRARLRVESASALALRLRVPGWAARAEARVIGAATRAVEGRGGGARFGGARFGGALFGRAEYLSLDLTPGTSEIELDFEMPIVLLEAHPRVSCTRGRVAIARGGLLYCAESIDNPGLDLEGLALDPATLRYEWEASLLGPGCGTIRGATRAGEPLRLVPYRYWGNRGPGAMRVWLLRAKAR